MRQLIRIALIAGPLAATLLGALAAQADNPSGRTFVAGLGADTGTCPRAAPCRSFAYAIGQTAAGGEIIALDSAGYGPVTITKSISIIGPDGGGAHITSGGTGIQISAGSSDSVFLRGLQIFGGSTGIDVGTVGRLDISDVMVSNAGSSGLLNRGAAKTTIAKSVFVNNHFGISHQSGLLVLNGVKVIGGFEGVRGFTDTQIVDCTIENVSVGIYVANTNRTFVKGSLFTGNSTALSVVGTAVIDTTTFTGNGEAVRVGFGSVRSYGNNNIVDNSGPLTTVSPD